MEPGLTAAHFAALGNHATCLLELVAHGADVHMPTESDEISFRPIHLTRVNKHMEALSVLKDAGGDVESPFTHYILRTPKPQGGYTYNLMGAYHGEF
ncbi:hypothetical protein RRF57_001635 [Xylaria bambusicola]|uniref:Ankyrin repeat protein n=1 Tax=Xylaria bambusicola TaxID=326684 RepID=A0AAN7UHA6_9PEZI